MNWQAVSAVADILAATGVIISAIYLVRQLRGAVQAVRASTMQSITSDASQFNYLFFGSAEFTKIILTGYNDEYLDMVDAYRFRRFMHSYFSFHENLHFQFKNKTLDEELWNGYLAALERIISYPGCQNWWRDNFEMHSNAFQDLINKLLAAAKELRNQGTK